MEIRRDGGITFVRLTGADLADPVNLHKKFEAAVIFEGDRKLLVDLSAVSYMNSTQIGAVVGLHCLAYENLAVVKFVGLGERIAMLFRLLGVDTLLDMHYARAKSALESFGVYGPAEETSAPPCVAGSAEQGAEPQQGQPRPPGSRGQNPKPGK